MKIQGHLLLTIAFFVFFGLSWQARGALISECGTYEVEGYYTRIKSRLHGGQTKDVILIERGSNSEIRFFPENSESSLNALIPETHRGVNFRLRLKFASACFYDCTGQLIEVVEPLKPYEIPRPFLSPRPVPIKGTEVKCAPGTLAAPRDLPAMGK